MDQEVKSCCTPSAKRNARQEGLSVPRTNSLQVTSTDGMVTLPGGRFLMGTDYEFGFPADGEGPVRSVNLSPFSIDTMPVTNAQFAEFIKDTKYVTEAERYNWSFVFWAHIPQVSFDQLVADTVAGAPWWCKVFGAKWNSPEGPGSQIEDRQDYPVVHVAYTDAAAYAAWAGKQLPTEAEWEYAARGGLEQKLFPWGDDLEPNGQHLCNVWQGQFPSKDTAADGYAGASPVQAFPPNGYGLYSMTGNVWEWTQDWFTATHPKHEVLNPRGPKYGTDKVTKGGSFLCHASYCNRYRVAARTKNTPDSSTSNIGFRCVRRDI
jgi:formylglycine-generating enzyme required for sulfatase activity